MVVRDYAWCPNVIRNSLCVNQQRDARQVNTRENGRDGQNILPPPYAGTPVLHPADSPPNLRSPLPLRTGEELPEHVARLPPRPLRIQCDRERDQEKTRTSSAMLS